MIFHFSLSVRHSRTALLQSMISGEAPHHQMIQAVRDAQAVPAAEAAADVEAAVLTDEGTLRRIALTHYFKDF